MKVTNTEQVIADFSSRVRKVLGSKLVAIYWFGSRARGEGTPESDYDLLLETRATPLENDRDAVADVAVDISADTGALLDIHYRTSEALAKESTRSPFIDTILRDAVLA
jgi:predicted nucleotidyltransferase